MLVYEGGATSCVIRWNCLAVTVQLLRLVDVVHQRISTVNTNYDFFCSFLYMSVTIEVCDNITTQLRTLLRSRSCRRRRCPHQTDSNIRSFLSGASQPSLPWRKGFGKRNTLQSVVPLCRQATLQAFTGPCLRRLPATALTVDALHAACVAKPVHSALHSSGSETQRGAATTRIRATACRLCRPAGCCPCGSERTKQTRDSRRSCCSCCSSASQRH
jgi:hypothetical protein